MTKSADHGRGPAHTLREVAALCTMHNNYPLAERLAAIQAFDDARTRLMSAVGLALVVLEDEDIAAYAELLAASNAMFGIDTP